MNQNQVIAKPHVVCVPFPAQGHITPMLQLSKLIHSLGFHITFVNTEFNHRRLIRSGGPHSVKGLPDFRFETIPDGLPPSDRDATQDPPSLSDSVRKNCLVPFMELIAKLNSSSLDVPPVSCIVCDGLMSFGIKAGEEMGIPVVQFWTASACGFMGYLQCGELVKRGIVPFKDEKFLSDGTLDTPIDWIPGMSNIRLKDFPSFIRTTDPNDIMFNFQRSEARNCLDSSAILINTFDDFEYEVLQSITSMFPNIYTIGPLNLLCRELLCENKYKSLRSSLWKEDFECVEWLDKREPHSVVYVNYGSVTVMSDQHFREFAWGLANSKHSFLWVVRPDIAKGNSVTFPAEYLEEIKDRGIITSWCPQEEVLSHASIGAFLTHCGWNSIMESMCEGIPLICWPFFAEQQTNCRYACTGTWGIGMEVNHDVKRSDIESIVKEMMEGDKGKEMKQNAQEWKRKVEVATSAEGSSYRNLNRFVNEVLHHENEQK